MKQHDLEMMISLLRPNFRLSDSRPDQEPLDQIPALAGLYRHFRENAVKGDEVALAIAETLPPDPGEAEQTLHSDFESNDIVFEVGKMQIRIHGVAAIVLGKLAADGLDRQDFRNAALIYAIVHQISATDTERADALCAVAYCAICLGRLADGLRLANASLELAQINPRAHCLAGLCQLQLGQRKAAQSALALAARQARGNAEYAEPLKAAQRLLLILHFED